MEPSLRKSRYFRYILLTFGILMVMEFSFNIFGLATFKVNSDLWRRFNASQYLTNDGGGGRGGGGDGEGDVDSRALVEEKKPLIVEKTEDDLFEITLRDSTAAPRSRKTQGSSSLGGDDGLEKDDVEAIIKTTKTSTTTTTTPTASRTAAVNAATSNQSELCPDPPPKLVGLLRVVKKPIELSAVEKLQSEGLSAGGFFQPADCVARHRVAIVIPFRDREEHLHIFLNHLLPILKRQLLEFQIYVVDLVPGVKFNRAMLMNIGFAEAIKQHDWQCFVFHDVDLLPENDKNIYSCPEKPRHMSAAVDTIFFGWGGEDDDVYNRIRAKGYKISRYPMAIARYSMITHKKDTPNPNRYKELNGGTRRMSWDGINSLKYKVVKIDKGKLFTRVVVSFDEKEMMKSVGKPKKSN